MNEDDPIGNNTGITQVEAKHAELALWKLLGNIAADDFYGEQLLILVTRIEQLEKRLAVVGAECEELAEWKDAVPISDILSVYEAASDDGYTNGAVREWLDEFEVTP